MHPTLQFDSPIDPPLCTIESDVRTKGIQLTASHTSSGSFSFLFRPRNQPATDRWLHLCWNRFNRTDNIYFTWHFQSWKLQIIVPQLYYKCEGRRRRRRSAFKQLSESLKRNYDLVSVLSGSSPPYPIHGQQFQLQLLRLNCGEISIFRVVK